MTNIFLGVLAEARFYNIESAINKLHHNDDLKNSKRLTRRDVLKAIMSTPTASELRFQGVAFYGADLSKLDLRNINFKVTKIISILGLAVNNTLKFVL